MSPDQRAKALRELEDERNFARGTWFSTYSTCGWVPEGKKKKAAAEVELQLPKVKVTR